MIHAAKNRCRNNRNRRKRIGSAGWSRTLGFQIETLESRTVLSHGTFFDFDGLDDAVGTVDGGVSNFTGFDWLPGAIYGVNGNQAVTNFLLNQGDGGDRDTTVQGYYHAKLGSFLAEGGDVPVPAGVEYTVVAGLAYEVESVNFIGVDVLATFQFIDSGERFFEFRYDDTPDAVELTGLGFNDGQLILSATPTEGNIDFRQENNDDGSPITDALDDNGTDNYPGTTTIIGNGDVGGAKADIGFSDPNFFQLPPGTGFGFGTFASTQELNFNNVDPSWQFTTAGGVMPFLPKPLNVDAAGNPDPGNPADPPLPPGTGIDTVNGFPLITPDGMPTGLGGPDNTLKADGSNSFEFVVAGSIHGFKFEDLDADGAYEPLDGEGPFTAYPVQFELTGDVDGDGVDETVTTTIDTDPNSPTAGEFWFTNLFPGDYTVREVTEDLPEHIMPSPNRPTSVDLVVGEGQELVWADGAAMLDPAVDPQVEVNVGEALIFGDFIKGSIHAFGFEDMDADGNYEPPTDTPWEDALPGKKIDLFDEGGVLIATQTTDATGQVWFEDLIPGVYMLQEDLTAFPGDGLGTIMPSPDPDGPGGVPGGADKRTVTVLSGQELVWQDGAAMGMLEQGQEEVLVDDGRLIFGNFIKGSIHAFGFEDMDADGNYEPPTDTPWEAALPGKKIDLLDANGNFITSATTDGTGQVWFLGLPPGVYMLQEDLTPFDLDGDGSNDNDHIMPSPDPDGPGGVPGGADKRTVTITSGKELVWQDGAAMGMLDVGQEEELVDDGRLIFGNFIKGSIHGFKFNDVNGDGIYDPATEAGVPGVTFTLTGTTFAGQQVGPVPTLTDDNGEFWFTFLTPGNYTVTETVPTGSTPTTPTEYNSDVFSGQELVAFDGQAMLLTGQEEVLRTQLRFGNTIRRGSIHGLKFLDGVVVQPGRMTGGGSVFTDDGERVTHGFELHCGDGTIGPNNLEINFSGNRFHLESLTSGVCSDDPDESPLPRQAPFEIFDGMGIGRFNGVSGFDITFQLTDFGEPGRRDIAEFDITAPDGTEILTVSGPLEFGNHQAHPENKRGADIQFNSDGEFNGDEPRVPGVTINLFLDSNGDGEPQPEELIDSMVTDENGEYWFADDPATEENEGLPPGTYIVREVVPEGSEQTTENPPPLTIDGAQEYVASAEQQAALEAKGVVAEFIIEPRLAFGNTPIVTPTGRMTGGGSVFTVDGMRVTHGFELHCNPDIDPNNLQVNFDGNRFHLTDLETVHCVETELQQTPAREAPFDTYTADGVGRFNGVDGYHIQFVLTDNGEPGNKKDFAEIHITDPDNNDVVFVSNVLMSGNHQAHPENKTVRMTGDANLDGFVDSTDFTLSIINYTGPDAKGKPKTVDQGDADGDGDVDSADITALIVGYTGASPSSSDEVDAALAAPLDAVVPAEIATLQPQPLRTPTTTAISDGLSDRDDVRIAKRQQSWSAARRSTSANRDDGGNTDVFVRLTDDALAAW